MASKFHCCFMAFSVGIFCTFASIGYSETLEELISITLKNNPELQSSLSLREASDAQVNSARWQYYPTPTVDVQSVIASSDDTTYVGDDYTVSIGLIQPLWHGGAISNNLKSAKISLSLSDSEVAKTQQELALRVLSTYANWLSSTLRVEAWQDSVTIHKKLSEQVQRRASGGASSESDLALADARTTQTEAEVFSAIAQQQAALSGLTALASRNFLSKDLNGDQAQPISIQDDLVRLQEKAEAFSPDIIRARLEVDLVEVESRLVLSEQLPTVNLRIERQYGDLTTADTSPSNRAFIEFTSRFGAGLSGSSNISTTELKKEAAIYNIEAQRRTLAATLMSDIALKNSIESRLVALEKSKIATKNVYESFERQFLSGSKNWLDLLNAAREITQIDIQLADAQSSLVLVTWRLAILTGGLQSVLIKF